MIILDTCALIFDALNPEKLSIKAARAIVDAEKQDALHCCDISLWEIALLIQKKRLDPGVGTSIFLNLVLSARSITVLAINPAIAALSSEYDFKHQDPADRLIASTALHYGAPLVTCDQHLLSLTDLDIIW